MLYRGDCTAGTATVTTGNYIVTISAVTPTHSTTVSECYRCRHPTGNCHCNIVVCSFAQVPEAIAHPFHWPSQSLKSWLIRIGWKPPVPRYRRPSRPRVHFLAHKRGRENYRRAPGHAVGHSPRCRRRA